MDVAKRIQELLILRGMSQKDLADALQMSQSFVSQLCNGRKNVTLNTLEAICDALGISMAEFFARDKKSSWRFSANAYRIASAFDTLTSDQQEVILNLIQIFRHSSRQFDRPDHALMDVQGVSAAGLPLYDDSLDKTVALPAKYNDGRFFLVQARGDSMEPRIHDGDYVVVQKDVVPDPGGIGLVRVSGDGVDEYTIKRVRQRGSSIILTSINKAYDPLIYPVSDVHSMEMVVDIIPAR